MNINKIKKQHDKYYKTYIDFRDKSIMQVREHLTAVREKAGLNKSTMGRLLGQRHVKSYCDQIENGVRHGCGKVVYYSLETLMGYVPQYEALAAKVSGLTDEIIKIVASTTPTKPRRKYTRRK